MTGLPNECWDCHQPIVWAVTAANSKRIMLNPDPDPKGNQAAYRDHTETYRTRQIKDDEEPRGYERRMMPHVATCEKRQQAPTATRQPEQPRALPQNVVQLADWRRSTHSRKDRP
jgi:hypothetical protein